MKCARKAGITDQPPGQPRNWKARLAIMAGLALSLAIVGASALKSRRLHPSDDRSSHDKAPPPPLAGATGMKTFYLTANEGQIAYDDTEGSGPVVICVPGLGDVRAEYRYLVPQLMAAGYRVVTMDIRGHGETSVAWMDNSVAGIGADILALARHLNAGPVTVIGTSMAAGAAAWAAAEAPRAIRNLVLIGPAVHDSGPQWKKSLMTLLCTVLFNGPWGAAAWSWYYASLYPAFKPADLPAYITRLRQNLKEPGRLRAMRRMISASKEASEARLSRVQAPALILMGSRDPDFKDPAAEARLVGAHLHGEVKVIEGAGHYPHAEMPDQTASLITRFLQQTRAIAHGA